MNHESIPCAVCRDLLPLVQDGVASADSCALVKAHLESCAACRQLGEAPSEALPEPGERPLRRVKRTLWIGALALLVAGALLGAGLSNSYAMFHNVWIMPCLGVCAYALLGRRWYWAPAAVAVLATATQVVLGIARGEFAEGLATLLGIALFTGIYVLLLCAGVAVAALLGYAFRKGEKHE
ncbi:MAG: zf-HC2 domain-containing protein [Eubacteriales bacterium]|nr:zf-HC2 domain-containing protein [Eubacteriales bacterium]